MSGQALNLRRLAQIVRRHKIPSPAATTSTSRHELR